MFLAVGSVDPLGGSRGRSLEPLLPPITCRFYGSTFDLQATYSRRPVQAIACWRHFQIRPLCGSRIQSDLNGFTRRVFDTRRAGKYVACDHGAIFRIAQRDVRFLLTEFATANQNTAAARLDCGALPFGFPLHERAITEANRADTADLGDLIARPQKALLLMRMTPRFVARTSTMVGSSP